MRTDRSGSLNSEGGVQIQGSHFSGLTKFPDFSGILAIFPVFFKCLFFNWKFNPFYQKCTVHLNITKNIK